MKKLAWTLLLTAVCAGPCAAQRHPYNSHPYHPPTPPQRAPREVRRVSTPKPVTTQPVAPSKPAAATSKQ